MPDLFCLPPSLARGRLHKLSGIVVESNIEKIRKNAAFENLWSENPQKLRFPKDCIGVEVIWDSNGTQKTDPLENMVINQTNQKGITPKSIIFTGSKVIEGTYMAEISGSILAVYADEDAILNSSDIDSDNDDVWIANENTMPPLESRVRIRFLLPE